MRVVVGSHDNRNGADGVACSIQALPSKRAERTSGPVPSGPLVTHARRLASGDQVGNRLTVPSDAAVSGTWLVPSPSIVSSWPSALCTAMRGPCSSSRSGSSSARPGGFGTGVGDGRGVGAGSPARSASSRSLPSVVLRRCRCRSCGRRRRRGGIGGEAAFVGVGARRSHEGRGDDETDQDAQGSAFARVAGGRTTRQQGTGHVTGRPRGPAGDSASSALGEVGPAGAVPPSQPAVGGGVGVPAGDRRRPGR